MAEFMVTIERTVTRQILIRSPSLEAARATTEAYIRQAEGPDIIRIKSITRKDAL